MLDLMTVPDRRLADWLFYTDARNAELAEMDGFVCHDEGDDHDADACDFCRQRDAASREYAAVVAELERRERLGLFIEDPDEPTLEERLGPYGLEWQAEQRDRAEGR